MTSSTIMYPRIIEARVASERRSQRMFIGAAAVLFAGSAVLTVRWCESMSAMGGMPMPGGWTMSMAWMRMPGQTWAGAAAAFLVMWTAMMTAMMLPSLTPVLLRYRDAVSRTGEGPLELLTALAGTGYFTVWSALGIVVFAVGDTLARLEMRQALLARAVPVAAGVVILISGVLQFSRWKAHHLARCRDATGRDFIRTTGAGTAWQYGLRLGLHCICDCAGWTSILLVFGVMDVRVMAVVTGAITAERLAPTGVRVARAMGGVVMGAGLLLTIRAGGLG